MRIDAHAHGIHAELNEEGTRRIPPLMSAWRDTEITPEEHVKKHNDLGIEKVLLLDPPDIVFELKETFGDFILPCPQVEMEKSSPDEISAILEKGACGIKFIAPLHPYGADIYLPLYEVIRDYKALAVFHTGYLTHGFYDPGLLLARENWIDMKHMRPAEIDRINRAFPDLNILMAHFGNPWWEEAWTMLKSNKNVYADFSGGTAYKKSMNMWKELFAPNGKVDEKIVSKLCYGADDSMFSPGYFGYQAFLDFYDRFYDELNLSDEIRRKIDYENIQLLTMGR
ncbi:MAG: amidohydrolase family protein [Planctomycetota bacterium]|jgi:predicted TIM-barrel fold metal-dependent hydrolase